MSPIYFVFEWSDCWKLIAVVDHTNAILLRDSIYAESGAKVISNRLVAQWSVGYGVTVSHFSPPAEYPDWIGPISADAIAQRALDAGPFDVSVRSQVVVEVQKRYGGTK